jgi:hypothetical protein
MITSIPRFQSSQLSSDVCLASSSPKHVWHPPLRVFGLIPFNFHALLYTAIYPTKNLFLDTILMSFPLKNLVRCFVFQHHYMCLSLSLFLSSYTHGAPSTQMLTQYYTRWFKYDRDYLCVNKSQFVPVIFEPPCTIISSLNSAVQLVTLTLLFCHS